MYGAEHTYNVSKIIQLTVLQKTYTNKQAAGKNSFLHYEWPMTNDHFQSRNTHTQAHMC